MYQYIRKSPVTWCHPKRQEKLVLESRFAPCNLNHSANSSLRLEDEPRRMEKTTCKEITRRLQDESRVILWSGQEGQWWPSRSATGAFFFPERDKVLAPPQCALRLRPKRHTTLWVSHYKVCWNTTLSRHLFSVLVRGLGKESLRHATFLLPVIWTVERAVVH